MAFDPGKRWRAGRSANAAARASGSISAMAAASSRPPRRSFSLSGAENAHSSGTCWSSTIPMRSANGSSDRRRSAASSPESVRAGVAGIDR